MATVTIRRVGGDEDGYESVGIEVLVDGEMVGDGRIGGEPEDNCERRDYGWIRPLFRALAVKLGAEVTEERVPDPDEDEDA